MTTTSTVGFPELSDVAAYVAGIDRERDSVEYARTHYPEIQFEACDVLDVPRVLTGRLDLIYMLNSFYGFDAQRDALAALEEVAADDARLVIFGAFC